MLANICCEHSNYIDYANLIMIIVEVIGLAFVCFTIKKDKKIKEAEFISEYNFQFIASPPLVDMERKLEACYQKYKDNDGFADSAEGFKKAWDAMSAIMAFSPPSASNGSISRSYQKMINYLVYWEAFAPLILSGQVQLNAIDDTFGYRYFIAMNNPVVQAYELLEEAEFYRGCLCLYEKWYQYRKEYGKEIPMEEYALCHTGDKPYKKTSPVYYFNYAESNSNINGLQLLQNYNNAVQRKKNIISRKLSYLKKKIRGEE